MMLWEALRAVTIFNRQRMGPGDPIQFPEGGYTDFEWSLLVCPVAGVSREGEPAGSPWECVSGGEEPWGGGGGGCRHRPQVLTLTHHSLAVGQLLGCLEPQCPRPCDSEKLLLSAAVRPGSAEGL